MRAEAAWALIVPAVVAVVCLVVWWTYPRYQRSQPLRWTLIIATCVAGVAAIINVWVFVVSVMTFGLDFTLGRLDCESITPSELPSGAEPGPVTEGVAGGAKSLTWGTGRNTVELRLGLSSYAEGFDRPIARTEVRGEPAIVSASGLGEPDVSIDWGEACQYSMTLSPDLTDTEVVDYAQRF